MTLGLTEEGSSTIQCLAAAAAVRHGSGGYRRAQQQLLQGSGRGAAVGRCTRARGRTGAARDTGKKHGHDELVAMADDGFGLEQSDEYDGGSAREGEGNG